MFDESLVFAELDFTQSGQPTADDTVTVAGKVYTFVAEPSSAGEVDIGADAEGSNDNLIAAINGDDLNTANAHVRATKVSATVFTVKSRVAGAIGNFITVSESHTNGAWEGGGTVLASGDGDLHQYITEILDNSQVDSEQHQGLSDALHSV